VGGISPGVLSPPARRQRRTPAAHAAPSRLPSLTKLGRPGFGRAVVRTAGFNVAAMVAAGLGGIILARALGPTVRGEYAAVTSWFGFALMIGGMGQPAALCFYVASDPERAREYVATSRAMMLTTGALTLGAGILLAPLLAHGQHGVATGYRIAFGASIVAFVGASYTFSLQARNLRAWNLVRVSQPILALIAIGVLWRLQLLSLNAALIILAATMVLQLGWAYRCGRKAGLVPGHARAALIRPLAVYGVAQIAALTPAALNADLDQLMLSQLVRPADLGRYAIAVSLSSLPIPLVGVYGAAIASTIAYGIALAAMLRCLWRLPRAEAATLNMPVTPARTIAEA
jgi:O-antigen/teichoic acid export membrane protein